MKKRLLIAILILTLTILISLISQKIVLIKIENVIMCLQEIQISLNNQNIPTETYNKLKDNWKQSKKVLQVFVAHDKILKVENNISTLNEYFQDEYLQTARKICIDTIIVLKTVKEETCIIIENIL